MTNPTEESRKAFEEDLSHLYKGFYNRDPNNEYCYKSERVNSAWVGWQASESRVRAQMQEMVEALRKIEYESSMFLMHEEGAVSAGICNRIAREATTRISKAGA